MSNFILTMLDTSGIQPYIFGSNRLQENIGASELVYRATTLWAFEALAKANFKHNVLKPALLDWDLDPNRAIEHDATLDAEVVYAGGGNTFIIFRNLDQAKLFAQVLTRKILEEAAGLTVVAQHLSIEWNNPDHRLDMKRKELLRKLGAHKQARLPSMPLLGLGVTAACESTGLVAVQTNEKLKLRKEEETRLISREIACKLRWRNKANERLLHYLEPLPSGTHFEFPYEIDKLGRIEGEESYVAVIHADGNGMGGHIDRIGERVAKEVDATDVAKFNREYVKQIRSFSQEVNKAGLAALGAVVAELDKAIKWSKDKKKYLVSDKVPLEDNLYLPIRPLVFGGDDVTFLCNAQLGLALATVYLKAFEYETKKEERNLRAMHACAGIAMVKMHYPFARAYALSEQLAGNAKKFVREEAKEDCSALDWHFALSGLSGSLGAIRKREYERSNGDKLYLRPVRLYKKDDTDQHGRYWIDGIERVIHEFQNDEKWEKRRNKVKGLREHLRLGPLEVEKYCFEYALPALPELIAGEKHGWAGDRCVYFDAIELMDHHVPLKAVEETT
ncbi:hypothetical protein DCC62_00925 [candidate division KSB1 bacterium]|nr:MAG: hypothetical protein DCC62_00925 [candidate division KSB1 bacterium]